MHSKRIEPSTLYKWAWRLDLRNGIRDVKMKKAGAPSCFTCHHLIWTFPSVQVCQTLHFAASPVTVSLISTSGIMMSSFFFCIESLLMPLSNLLPEWPAKSVLGQQPPRRCLSQHQQPHYFRLLVLRHHLYLLATWRAMRLQPQLLVCLHHILSVTADHVYQIYRQALLEVKGHPSHGSEQLQHKSTLGPRENRPRIPVSITCKFFFLLMIDTLWLS